MPGLADIQGMNTGQQIADKYGYSGYADYFNPLNQGLNEQSKAGYWDKNYGDPMRQSATNRFQSNVGSAKKGGRDTLLQNLLSKYGAQSKSGFAGSGAINRESSLGDMSARKNYGQQYAGMQDAYGREQFSIGQDVIGKQGATTSAIDSWYKGILDSLMRLKETDAKKDTTVMGGGGSSNFGTPAFGGSQDTDDRASSGATQEWLDQFEFPDNPSNLQRFTSANGTNWIFNGPGGWEIDFGQGGSGAGTGGGGGNGTGPGDTSGWDEDDWESYYRDQQDRDNP